MRNLERKGSRYFLFRRPVMAMQQDDSALALKEVTRTMEHFECLHGNPHKRHDSAAGRAP